MVHLGNVTIVTTTESDRPLLVLASASPARLRTLRAAGIDPEVVVSGVDESAVDATRAETLAGTLARMKAEAVAARLRSRGPLEPNDAGVGPRRRLVLGCDSVLAFDGTILGKPADAGEATRRWQAMRGGEGVLHTGHCLIDLDTGKNAEAVAGTTVRFADISDDELAAYIGTGEPMAVAGAFTIDGLGGWFLESISGDAGTVIGVSLPTLRRLLAELGVTVADLWGPMP
jgi:septum formation protein